MFVRDARKKALQLEMLERRDLLTALIMFHGPSVVRGSEAQTVVNVPVDCYRLAPDVPRPVTVNYAVVKQGRFGIEPWLAIAEPGKDYRLVDGSTAGGSLTFGPSETRKYIRIRVADNKALEPDRDIKLSLIGSPSPDVSISKLNQFDYIIEDNDATSWNPLATPGAIQGYLKGRAFWGPTKKFGVPDYFDMSQDSGFVWVFTNEVIGQTREGINVFQGYLIAVQHGKRGQVTSFDWATYVRPIVEGDKTVELPAVIIAIGSQPPFDLLGLHASRNNSDELLQWYVLPSDAVDPLRSRLGYFYELHSKQVPATVRGQFQLHPERSPDQAVNAPARDPFKALDAAPNDPDGIGWLGDPGDVTGLVAQDRAQVHRHG